MFQKKKFTLFSLTSSRLIAFFCPSIHLYFTAKQTLYDRLPATAVAVNGLAALIVVVFATTTAAFSSFQKSSSSLRLEGKNEIMMTTERFLPPSFIDCWFDEFFTAIFCFCIDWFRDFLGRFTRVTPMCLLAYYGLVTFNWPQSIKDWWLFLYFLSRYIAWSVYS